MPGDPPVFLPYLVEVGPYKFNCVYVVMTERKQKPGEEDDEEVTVLPGRIVRLTGDNASLFRRRFSRLLPPDPDEGEPDVPTARVVAPPPAPTGTGARRPKRR